MFDKDIVIENLKHICCAIDKIIKRFAYIDSANDFLKDDTGLEKLDSICMQLKPKFLSPPWVDSETIYLEAGVIKEKNTTNAKTVAYSHPIRIEVEDFITQNVLVDFLPNLYIPLLGR